MGKRTNGAEKRTNGAEKRTNGAEKRTNGAEKRKCSLGPPSTHLLDCRVSCPKQSASTDC